MDISCRLYISGGRTAKWFGGGWCFIDYLGWFFRLFKKDVKECKLLASILLLIHFSKLFIAIIRRIQASKLYVSILHDIFRRNYNQSIFSNSRFEIFAVYGWVGDQGLFEPLEAFLNIHIDKWANKSFFIMVQIPKSPPPFNQPTRPHCWSKVKRETFNWISN